MKLQCETDSRQTSVHETTGVRYFTTVTEKQTFTDGQYAGKSYRITSLYVSTAAGHRGQFLKSTSEPWESK